MIKRWKEFWKDKRYRYNFILYTILSNILLALTPWHMDNVEARKGVLLNDYVVNFLPATDFSFYIMTLLYGIILTALVWLFQNPLQLTIAVKTFFFATLLRYIFIYIISLEPPVGLIPLKDPFLEAFVYSNKLITKDLFFSGHAESTFLAFLAVKNRTLKFSILVGVILLSIMILFQHVHYTSDILGAVIVTWGLYAVFEKNICFVKSTPVSIKVPV
jgi:hypothetical protein